MPRHPANSRSFNVVMAGPAIRRDDRQSLSCRFRGGRRSALAGSLTGAGASSNPTAWTRSVAVTGIGRNAPTPSAWCASSGGPTNRTLIFGRLRQVICAKERPVCLPGSNSNRVTSTSTGCGASIACNAGVRSVKAVT